MIAWDGLIPCVFRIASASFRKDGSMRCWRRLEGIENGMNVLQSYSSPFGQASAAVEGKSRQKPPRRRPVIETAPDGKLGYTTSIACCNKNSPCTSMGMSEPERIG